jgi:hypothetical protein
MSDIVAVLVVPAEGDPGGLLAAGACGSIPPLVRRWDTARGPWWGRHYCPEGSVVTDDYGLPLWWDGSLVPEGWDRARRAYVAGAGAVLSHPAVRQVELLDPTPDQAVVLADGLLYRSFASRVVRLTRVDGRLVELEPVGVGT